MPPPLKRIGFVVGTFLFLVTFTAPLQAAPMVRVISPNRAERWTGGTPQEVKWDANGVEGIYVVDVYYRDTEDAPWKPVARNKAKNGSFTWFVHNTPTTAARVRVVARDSLTGIEGEDISDVPFTIVAMPGGRIHTTLRDFHQPGTQPLDAGVDFELRPLNLTSGSAFDNSNSCNCHGVSEIKGAFDGTMMAQAARDPLFYACLAIAEQDAPSSGDLCLRCHSPTG